MRTVRALNGKARERRFPMEKFGAKPSLSRLAAWFRRKPAESRNKGVVRGEWGEDVAVEFLRRAGFEIVDRNPRPVKSDSRLEIDVVAWDSRSDTMVFVEVKQHAVVSRFSRRMRSVDRRKLDNLRRACNAWRRANRWRGAYRFDVIEVYGTPEGGRPVVDHIEHVNLFARRDRFVKWN